MKTFDIIGPDKEIIPGLVEKINTLTKTVTKAIPIIL